VSCHRKSHDVRRRYPSPRLRTGPGLAPHHRARSFLDAIAFWDAIAFLLNSVVFLLIGLDLPLTSLLGHPGLVLAAFAIVTLARAVAVHGLLLLLRPFGRAVNLRWQVLISWSGLRGAVAIALLLSLEGGSSELAAVKPIAYGVVLLSIVLQGATIGPLARALLPHGWERSSTRTSAHG